MFLHQKCIFRKKKFPKSLSVQKLLVPLQPQISKVVFAQMAESVDALVSNTSGAIHPGSIPGLGTKKERSELLSFFRLYTLAYIHIYPCISTHLHPIISPFHGNGEYWFPSEGALKADETTPCFRNIDIKNVTVNDKTYKKIDEKGITLDF